MNTSTKKKRAPIPHDVREEVMWMSRRRCCMCFGLNGDMTLKEGQLAHLDQDCTNPAPENLAFLCQPCHTDYDKKSNRVLRFTPGEVRRYRDQLYKNLGHDSIELNITMRVHREDYEVAKATIDEAKTILLKITRDVTIKEGPVNSK